MPLTYREFSGTDADYQLFVDIHNTAAIGRTSPESLRLREEFGPDWVYHRTFILSGETCIGALERRHQRNGQWSCYHHIELSLLPEHRGKSYETEIYHYAIAQSIESGATRAITYARNDDPSKVQIIKELGFQQNMPYVVSRLDLNAFEPSLFDSSVQQVKAEGVRLLSAVELQDQGIAWIRLLYDLMGMGPYQAYDTFLKLESDPRKSFPECQYAAFVGDRCVGLTSVDHVPGEPDQTYCPYTGVIEEFQRRGIARALKVVCQTTAKELGKRWIDTNNVDESKMHILNLQLGFEPRYTHAVYTKDL